MTNSSSSALLTDLYQLTMLQGYFDQGMEETAVFEFFVPKLHRARNFLLAAGLEQALAYLESVRFTPAELEWIAAYGAFRPDFVRYLENFRFTGDVHAIAEGTVFFSNEPIFRLTAPIAQAQLVESRGVDGEALIRPVMKAGQRLSAPEPLAQSRARALRELNRLPEALKSLERAPDFPVTVSEALRNLARDVDTLQLQATTRLRGAASEQSATS